MPCFLIAYGVVLLVFLLFSAELPESILWPRRFLAIFASLLGFGYAYTEYGKHGDAGVSGIICGVLGVLLFIDAAAWKRHE